LIDIGTTNDALRNDPLYLGLRSLPPSDAELDAFVDEFVSAVQHVFPECCIHFEDWKGTDAIRLLAKYSDNVCCYNDDIQGTASVVLAGLTTGLQIKDESLTDQRFLFVGAGSAGLGIANLLVSAMQLDGLGKDDAEARISMFDDHGLLEPSRKDMSSSQQVYAHVAAPTTDLNAAIDAFRPTALIGASTVKGIFTKQVIQTMAKLNARPIIFALSNPTDKTECTAQEAYEYTDGTTLCCRRSISGPSGQRQAVSSGSGQQLLHLSGNRLGGLRGKA
jgi:malate dehydrogenase (oxaloacetate-decarboxylating)(NADP+)